MRLTELLGHIERLNWSCRMLESPDGGAVVALERGGRIIGVYPDKNGGNLLWTSPDLSSPQRSEWKYCREEHWNAGGERVWLSPEAEFNVPELGRAGSYEVQRSIDPGEYVLEPMKADGVQAAWSQTARAKSYRHAGSFEYKLAKTCRLAADPLRGESLAATAYAYVGYETTAVLDVNACAPGLNVSLWTLMQVPAGGEALISTFGVAQVTDFFAITDSSRLTVAEGEVRFRIDGREAHKISVKAVDSAGRFGYFRRLGDGRYSLLVRRIDVDPSRSYRDVPMHDPSDTGHAVQMYSDDGQLGDFGELEHHTGAIAPVSGRPESARLSETSTVWAYTGPRKVVADAAYRLLGIRP